MTPDDPPHGRMTHPTRKMHARDDGPVGAKLDPATVTIA